MSSSQQLHEVLYVSTIAPDAPISIVADIATKARITNAAKDITGLLVFDGARFCQQLEGKAKDVVRMMEHIQQDPRHIEVELLHQGPLTERRFRRFSLGFVSLDDVDPLEEIEALSGQAAVAAFMALVPLVDPEC